MNISWCLPQPMLQEAPTDSGLFWRVLPFQLRDLAYLEGWICQQAGHPLEGERAKLRVLRHMAGGDYRSQATPESIAFADALWEYQWLRDEPHCWPPPLLSETGQEFLATPDGRLEFLWLLVSRTQPEWTRETLRPVLDHMDLEAWLALESIAYSRHPGEELSKLMDASESGSFSWGEEIFKLCEAFHTLDFDAIGRLYLTQWTLLRTQGHYIPGSMNGSDHWKEKVGWSRAEAIERMRRRHEGANGDGNGDGGTNGANGHPQV